jgi:hypothetical protein
MVIDVIPDGYLRFRALIVLDFLLALMVVWKRVYVYFYQMVA